MLTFRDTGKKFETQGDLLEKKTTEKYYVDLATLSDKKNNVWFCKRNEVRWETSR